MPKSSSLTCPSVLTSTLAGLMSRWTIRLACACATASSTSRNRRRRASMPSARSSQYRSMRLAVDVLEHEIRLAGRRDAGVDQMRDVRMAQPREDGAFAPEPLLAGAADQRDVQQLDRGASLEAAVAALGEPDAARCRPGRSATPAGTRRRPGPPATARASAADRATARSRKRESCTTWRARRACVCRSAASAASRAEIDASHAAALGRRRSPAPRRGTG